MSWWYHTGRTQGPPWKVSYQQYVLTAKVNILLISVGVGKNVYLKHQKWGGGTEEEENKGKKTS